MTTGTFLNGLVHVGRDQRPSGRAGEPPSRDLAESIKAIGFTWGRLKTGTPPRLDRRSIDFSVFTPERGDDPPVPFSFTTDEIRRAQIDCHLLHTTDRVHELVRQHIGESPLFNGQISGIGPRYCPSLEDKVMRFAHRERHQLFLEPEGLDVDEIYINGFSMSLPAAVQEALVHALPGLEDAVVMRPATRSSTISCNRPNCIEAWRPSGCAGCSWPARSTGRPVMRRPRPRGWLPGSTPRWLRRGSTPFVLGRETSYIGTMIDDLTTKGCLEPYRMFTSRAEHRLLLRIDNADLRLTPTGRAIGARGRRPLGAVLPSPGRFERNRVSISRASVTVPNGERIPAARALKQPEVRLEALVACGPARARHRSGQPGHRPRERRDVVQVRGVFEAPGASRRSSASSGGTADSRRTSRFDGIPGLSREMVERLSTIRPGTLGQASRIPGVTPAAVAVIAAYLDRRAAARRGAVQ